MKEYRLNSDNNQITINRLEEILNTVPQRLRQFSSKEFSDKPSPGKWSKKQIIGHLIDSATNNHHRFVRAQFDDKPKISYDQELWNKHSYYDTMDDEHIISFWELYNRHLIEVIRRIPEDLMQRECSMGDESMYSISWLVDDYVRHLEHHLGQIFD